MAIPLSFTNLVNIALICISVRQSRRIDAASQFRRHETSRNPEEASSVQERNVRYSRGLLNVIRLVSVTILMAVMSSCVAYFGSHSSHHTVQLVTCFYDITKLFWGCKMLVV